MIICQECHSQIDDNAEFCPVCGKKIEQYQPQYDVAQSNVTPQVAPGAPTPTSVLVLGILSLALSWTGVVGIILGAIAKKKGTEAEVYYNPIPSQIKVGKILGLVGLILGIIYTLMWVIIVIIYLVPVLYILSNGY